MLLVIILISSSYDVNVCICLYYASLISGNEKNQGPVVQSIVSLTSSLRDQLVKCFCDLITKYTDFSF